MRVSAITLFPDYFSYSLSIGPLGKAAENNSLQFSTANPADFSTHPKALDDYPYGGGAGQVIRAEPVLKAIESVKRQGDTVALLSPAGQPFTAAMAKELASLEGLVLVCGRYGGIDERVMSAIDREISVTDAVLSGGEPAAAVVIDALVRFLPGALGNPESLRDSFEEGLLAPPVYTRPEVVRGERVPGVLLSGDHARIAEYRREEALRRTRDKRPDLFEHTGAKRSN